MARPLQVEFADAIYHVTTRGIERRAIAAGVSPVRRRARPSPATAASSPHV
jgi:hypothetical protein